MERSLDDFSYYLSGGILLLTGIERTVIQRQGPGVNLNYNANNIIVNIAVATKG
jgi:hypothetical protein